MLCPTVEGGQLKPVAYLPELTADGFLNPDRSFKSFIRDDKHFSPVIQFRWGYKASLEELQQYGDGIYLNEKNYWGGGPFANGCSALPDLWDAGLSDSLFLWLHIEHLNPTNDNNVYACLPAAPLLRAGGIAAGQAGQIAANSRPTFRSPSSAIARAI